MKRKRKGKENNRNRKNRVSFRKMNSSQSRERIEKKGFQQKVRRKKRLPIFLQMPQHPNTNIILPPFILESTKDNHSKPKNIVVQKGINNEPIQSLIRYSSQRKKTFLEGKKTKMFDVRIKKNYIIDYIDKNIINNVHKKVLKSEITSLYSTFRLIDKGYKTQLKNHIDEDEKYRELLAFFYQNKKNTGMFSLGRQETGCNITSENLLT